MLERDEPLIPDALIEPDLVAPFDIYCEISAIRWPSYVLGVAGLALVGTGVFVGVDNRNTLDDIRDRQTRNVCGADFCNGELDDAKIAPISLMDCGAVALCFWPHPSFFGCARRRRWRTDP